MFGRLDKSPLYVWPGINLSNPSMQTIPLCWNLIPSLNLSFFPLYHKNPPQTLTFHYCWMEGCNLAGTCPTSCIFFLLCSLINICCWDVTLKPNPLYPKGWALNFALKLLWNHSPIALTIATNHALLNLTFFFFKHSFELLFPLG